MSLGDTLRSIGPAGAPALAAGIVLALFELSEKAASIEAKDSLTKALKLLSLERVSASFPKIQSIFTTVFGERHFSVRCIAASVALSYSSILVLYGIYYLLRPADAHAIIEAIQGKWGIFNLYLVFLIVWSFLSIVPDYLNLLKVRWLLRLLQRYSSKGVTAIVALLIIDFVAGIAIFTTLSAFVMGYIFSLGIEQEILERDLPFTPVAFFSMAKNSALFSQYEGVLFYSGMVPSIWLWLYLLSIGVAWLLRKLGPTYQWSLWALDINKTPLRSVGIISSVTIFCVTTVAMIVYTAIS